MALKLVIWDYNGTLTDDLSRFTAAVNLFLREYGIPPATEEEVACYDGDIFGFYRQRSIDLPKAEIGSRVFQIYAESSEPLYLRPGATETLEKISQPQVLVTKHPTVLAEREIEGLGIRKYFSQILSGIRDKTAVFQQLCRDRMIAPSQAVVIGDRGEDITEGRLAGNRVIAISGYHPRHILERHQPDYLVDSLAEVYECLQRHSSKRE